MELSEVIVTAVFIGLVSVFIYGGIIFVPKLIKEKRFKKNLNNGDLSESGISEEMLLEMEKDEKEFELPELAEKNSIDLTEIEESSKDENEKK